MTVFANRAEAGRRLARELLALHDSDVVVLGLPRGGVAVAYPIAIALHAPLDVIVVRKLGVPRAPELAMGALGEDGTMVRDAEVLATTAISDEAFQAVQRRERAALGAEVTRLRQGRARIELAGRTALIVDDGMATGSSARVACQVARNLHAARVVVAVPVAAAGSLAHLEHADSVIYLACPRRFVAVGAHYRDFAAVSEAQVSQLLAAAHRR